MEEQAKPLPLHQNRLVLRQILFQLAFAGQRRRASDVLLFVVPVVNQEFADIADRNERLVQFPNLTGLKGLPRILRKSDLFHPIYNIRRN